MAFECATYEPDVVYLPTPGAIDPAICFGFDLGSRDQFAGSLSQSQDLGDDQRIPSDMTQSHWRHLLLGAMGEVTATILGQWTISMASQCLRAYEKSVEHSRTSQMSGKGQWFEYYDDKVMWRRVVSFLRRRRSDVLIFDADRTRF
ncbi:MAG: hypothetical protein OEV36_11735, partial [Myxococcales bacterium]|nr:hypothetical protein [Myxococcales bacterium]